MLFGVSGLTSLLSRHICYSFPPLKFETDWGQQLGKQTDHNHQAAPNTHRNRGFKAPPLPQRHVAVPENPRLSKVDHTYTLVTQSAAVAVAILVGLASPQEVQGSVAGAQGEQGWAPRCCRSRNEHAAMTWSIKENLTFIFLVTSAPEARSTLATSMRPLSAALQRGVSPSWMTWQPRWEPGRQQGAGQSVRVDTHTSPIPSPPHTINYSVCPLHPFTLIHTCVGRYDDVCM